jgi:hypothetical protein
LEACSCYLGFEEGTGEDTEEGTGEGTEEGTGEGTGEGTEGIVWDTAVDSKVGVLHTLRELDKVVVGSKVSGDLLQRVLKEVTRTFNTISLWSMIIVGLIIRCSTHNFLIFHPIYTF